MELLDIDIRLIFAIMNGKVSSAINRKLQKNFNAADVNLTPEQWTVMLYLSEQDGVTQQQLCNAVYKDKTSMTRLIDILERADVVVRQTNKLDRRANTVHLTPHGREMKDKAQKIALVTLREALKGLTMDDLRTCQSVMRCVFENLTADGRR